VKEFDETNNEATKQITVLERAIVLPEDERIDYVAIWIGVMIAIFVACMLILVRKRK
jgi:hypothetical protein